MMRLQIEDDNDQHLKNGLEYNAEREAWAEKASPLRPHRHLRHRPCH